MTRALVTSSKYSPGNMTPEALESLFVGRDKMLDDVLKRLAASALGKEKHYFLLVGARGMGKTHFVALLHHRLSHDPAYAAARKRLLIAYLNEEEWGVASFLDLLVRILRALASNDPALGARIEPIYTTYARDPSAAQSAAQALLIEYVGDRALLLICENLIDLFEGLGDEGQKRWRAFIQEHPFWTILATTTKMFGGVQLQKSPFYGFFTIRHLDRLDFETAALLLRQKALIDGRTDLAAALGTPTGRARVRAIHHLAGGNHRAYVTLSDFLSRESLDDLVTPFMRMVDDMTPYYQDQIRQLAPQQRKLVEFLSHAERPTIVKDVAARCLISPQTAAKQLGELTKLGFVEREKSGRETYYEISEPLMRICVEVKDNRTEHIKLFVALLREWFSGRELQTRLEEILHVNAAERRVDRVHFEAATEAWKQEETDPFLLALMHEAAQCLMQGDNNGCIEAVTRILEEDDGEHLQLVLLIALRRSGDLEQAVRRAQVAIKTYPESDRLMIEASKAFLARGAPKAALALANRAVSIAPNDGHYHLVHAHALSRLGQHAECLEALDKAKINSKEMPPGDEVMYLVLKTNSLVWLSRYTEAIAVSASIEGIENGVDAIFVCGAYVGAVGFDAGLKRLSQFLKKDAPSDEMVVSTIGGMIEVSAISCGVASTIGSLARLRSTLEEYGRGQAFATAATDFVRRKLRRRSLSEGEWVSSLPILAVALADIAECAMPLAMLSVGVRYVQNNDKDALLELPLEQRTLLLEAIDPPPKPEEPAISLPPLSTARSRRSATKQATAKRRPKAAATGGEAKAPSLRPQR